MSDEIEIIDMRDAPDLPSIMTLGELRIVHVFAERYAAEQGLDEDGEVSIRVRDLGPRGHVNQAHWVEFSVGEKRMALDRQTLAIHEVVDGAVSDDPIHYP